MAQYKLSGNATKIYNVFTSHLQIILELRSLASTIVSVSRKKKKKILFNQNKRHHFVSLAILTDYAF